MGFEVVVSAIPIAGDNEESCIRRAAAQAITSSQAIAALRIQSRWTEPFRGRRPAFGISFARPARSSWVVDDPQPSISLPPRFHPPNPRSSVALNAPFFADFISFSRSAWGIPAPPLTTVIWRTPW